MTVRSQTTVRARTRRTAPGRLVAAEIGTPLVDVVIVGAGHAGVEVLSALQRLGFQGTTALLSDEQDAPYERPPLSKDFLSSGREHSHFLLRSTEFWSQGGVDLRLRSRVVAVDTVRRSVHLRDGSRLRYGALVWAAGGRARELGVAGDGDGDGRVFTLRTLADATRLRRGVKEMRRLAVVGGGFLGLEAAASLVALGKDVAVLEASERVLSRGCSVALAERIVSRHEEAGVALMCGTRISALRRADSALALELDDRTVLDVDGVLVCVGMTPNSAVLERAGVECDRGVVVNGRGETSVAHVYAAGDCTSSAGSGRGHESVHAAITQGRAVAASIMGVASSDAVDVPTVWTHQFDLHIRIAGTIQGSEQSVVRGDPRSTRFSVVHIRSDRVTGIETVNRVRDYVQGRALIEAGSTVDPRLLADDDRQLGAMVETRR